MKRLAVVLVGLAWVLSCQAETVGFQFKGVSVPSFLDAVVRGVLGRDYVMGAGVLDDQKVTISIRSLEKPQVEEVVRAALASLGLTVTERAGVLFIDKGLAPGPVVPVVTPVAVPEGGVGPSPEGAAGPLPLDGAAVSAADVIKVYRPRHRSADFLAQVVKLAGGKALEGKGGRPDMLVYAVSEKRLESVEKLLEDADGKVAAVNVRAAVLEVLEGTDASRSFSGVLSLLGGRLGVNLKLGKVGDNHVSLTGTNLEAVLSAVEGDNRFRYVAEPRLRVLDGAKAKLTVGQDVPVRGSVTQAANGNQVQAVEYKTAGVVLTLSPVIYADSVLMTVGQQVSSVTVNSSSGIDSPVILRREAETTVEAAPGEVVMLAGMDETRESSSRNGVPWLPSFLDATSATRARSQIVVLLEVERI